ncbi:MAG: ABC transporter permease [Zoogloea sp.]|nr:ABC transporter permease [Zoogloea sp.]
MNESRPEPPHARYQRWRLIGLLLLAPCALAAPPTQLDPAACPPNAAFMDGDGPYDYRNPEGVDRLRRRQIEGHHFNLEVRTLKQGQTGTLGADIDFLLRYVPNHHEALVALMELSRRTGLERPPGTAKPVVCYFEYAKFFAPDDSTVRTIYGIFLFRHRLIRQSLAELEDATRLNPEDRNAQYNLGLIYADLAQYDKALVHARAAYQLGFPLPGLRNKLVRAGRWRGQPLAAASAGEPASGPGQASPGR